MSRNQRVSYPSCWRTTDKTLFVNETLCAASVPMKKRQIHVCSQRILRMVVTRRVPGDCRTPRDCPLSTGRAGWKRVRQTVSDVHTQKGAMVRGLSDRGQLRRGVPQQPAREAAWLARGTTATEGKGCSPLVALSDAGAPSMSCKAWDWALLRVHHSQAKKAGQGGGVDGGLAHARASAGAVKNFPDSTGFSGKNSSH